MNAPSLAELQTILKLAIPMAHGAGAILRDGLKNIAPSAVTYKSAETDPVTEYDHKAEAYLVAALRQRFPTHKIVGEEGGAYEALSAESLVLSGEAQSPINMAAAKDTELSTKHSLEWQIDPLDGTVNFAHGFPWFSVSMGLLCDGQPVAGVVYHPMLDETFSAILGGGAQRNGWPIHVSKTQPLSKALLNTGFPYDRRTSLQNNFDPFVQFQRVSQEVRRLGSAALDCCTVACGQMDGYWEMKIKPHDIAAGILIVREAGGSVTDFSGGNDIFAKAQIIASNGLIHEDMQKVLSVYTA